MTSIILENIAKSFGGTRVLDGIDLAVASGELLVIVGPSGCGKTTLLRLIAGLEPITSGRLMIGGQVMNDIPHARRGIAMVFQNYALYPHMNVRENMAFALRVAGVGRDRIETAVTRAARLLDLEDCLDRFPRALSGGQRQRVAIGRAIVREPAVFLFDEPLSNLDAGLRGAMRLEIARLKARLSDRTMIHVTHDQLEAMTLADRIVVLAGGRIAQVGRPLDLYERPETEFVARFIGSPAMNLIPATVIAAGAVTRLRLATAEISLARPTPPDLAGAEVNLGVRPEHLFPSGGPGLVAGRVDVVEALGEVSLIHLGGITAKLAGTRQDLGGQTLRLSADPAHLHLFHRGRSVMSHLPLG
ncbi:ABC transporter ATP-binding protein [Phaeovulum vinaykumarii]|uniref:Maltose ABC transporter ATP-binding protein /trehalose ABC transporter ATP-binding protein /sucrose ABC transporter ATP-binding protein n=1 Tax=Phaeovulum vinaykumarii TaxID=407234 RepID=A0A1N7LJI6_9RHOB|nr:sn-glycerol-3-phosphate ABC transporter ATP-binding protein UgpC [Phaeovulum vinaykumarii]SIS73966.1 maltose ABC transporter ATP-binding protein /trehalose ABC transporter ATP-binding protein /sucrose ABC transporter ATP-binding protein [Phaeovulum vinaykumarii]SOC04837.1 maltose ABC transporter ATP-binding protein /trehalose ABC transporter ATP-binding protein /sucrose ABC transporter ATP-binding protein [Phaeovulum vinaykumarii]